jgi:hypothetical protein
MELVTWNKWEFEGNGSKKLAYIGQRQEGVVEDFIENQRPQRTLVPRTLHIYDSSQVTN